jgi:NADPH:quinone reductase-like Zn-dependent oxidoreductase
MKVMELSDAWDLDHLRLAERPEPEPGPGEVKIRMQAAALNFRDTVMVRRGYGRRSGELPLVPVADGAGEVAAVGDGVTRVSVGDLVCPAFSQAWISGPLKEDYWPHNLGGPRDGVMQEVMVLGEQGVVRAPAGWTALQAATLPCAALTAWNAVVVCGRTAPGDVVLVQGTGGVSLFALLFARMMGARVIATSSSADKLERARALGADDVINYREDADWGRTARALAGGRGVDLVIEVGGAETLEPSLRAVRTAGTIAMIGVLSGADARLALGQVVTRALRLTGVTIGNRDMLEALIRAIDHKGLSPPIDDRVYRFEELADALRAFPRGAHFGKVCIRF